MMPKPMPMPRMCGTARRKPKFAPDATTITTLGPELRHIAAANRIRDANCSVIGRHGAHARPRGNYRPGTASKPCRHARRRLASRRERRRVMGDAPRLGIRLHGGLAPRRAVELAV